MSIVLNLSLSECEQTCVECVAVCLEAQLEATEAAVGGDALAWKSPAMCVCVGISEKRALCLILDVSVLSNAHF